MEGASNNATKKLLGFDYQKLLALESCLNAKENETIWIECFGDIALADKSTEVKHHLTRSVLNDAHIDFWKTLYNLANEYPILSGFNRFELLTTSEINDASIFFNWNNVTAEIKLSRITSVKSNKTISKYHDFIFSYEKNKLLTILEKLTIIGSQPMINQKYEELKSHASFLIIPDQHVDSFMHKMLGYISMKAIDDMDRWHIDRNEFKREMEGFAKPFIDKDYPFPHVAKKDVNRSDASKFNFIDELKKIDLDDTIVNNAIVDFLRAERSALKILKLHSSMADNLEEFDDALCDDLSLVKLKHSAVISHEKQKELEIVSTSKKMYSECLLLNNKKILGIQEIAGYYQKGRIHSIVDRKDFSWIFLEDNK
ncbi:hypothetical protein D9980_03000 [Serratia sp. 3ACOL1]|uniref:ABC-three component system protein n=1 Tax=Serratia sp. 3ACOL1 TaxID=2448483 RepID=UPI000EF43FD2|nr:ABC-three component system protein [Serratia sp. 3ACOL1]AYM89625.1 hypothetical protein D9980_03000 [Serratia sp. 3ACOL1]